MPLWSPDDPYGVATLRKVLLTLSIASIVFGGYRSTVRDSEFTTFVIAAAVLLIVGLFVESVAAAMAGKRTR